jgi:hypothetical protein
MRQPRWIARHKAQTLALTAAALVAAACSDNKEPPTAPGAAQSSGPVYNATWFAANAKPKFTSEGGASPFRTDKTIPYWSSSFTDPTNGVTYPYTMVGTSPFERNLGSSTVPTVIIPMRFVFADGSVMDPTDSHNPTGDDLALLKQSPIFQNNSYKLSGGDNTQYGDAVFRAQWNLTRSSYHVRLGQPTVLPTLTIQVPANQGFVIAADPTFDPPFPATALISGSWFSSQLNNAINTYGIEATVLPVFLTHNALLFNPATGGCCTIGYHGARGSRNGNGTQSVQTYMFSAMITPGTFGDPSLEFNGLSDIHAFSHEVSEWMDDPFVNNFVQPWEDLDFAPQYGCTSILETGDPVVGVWFPLSGNPMPTAGGVWHPEDEVHFSFFARQTPSIAYKGRYTYMGTFDHPAKNCS